MNKLQSNKIAFTSNINFISHVRYKKIAGMQNVNTIHEISNVNRIKKLINLNATDEIEYCIAGTVTKPQKNNRGYIFHFFPKDIFNKGFKQTTESLDMQKQLNVLSKIPDLKIFAIGGLSKDECYENWMSVKLLNILKRPFKKAINLDSTIFFSQSSKNVKPWERPKAEFIYNQVSDSYFVNCRKWVNGQYKDILNENEILDHFDYIHVSTNDTVFVNDEKIIF